MRGFPYCLSWKEKEKKGRFFCWQSQLVVGQVFLFFFFKHLYLQTSSPSISNFELYIILIVDSWKLWLWGQITSTSMWAWPRQSLYAGTITSIWFNAKFSQDDPGGILVALGEKGECSVISQSALKDCSVWPCPELGVPCAPKRGRHTCSLPAGSVVKENGTRPPAVGLTHMAIIPLFPQHGKKIRD